MSIFLWALNQLNKYHVKSSKVDTMKNFCPMNYYPNICIIFPICFEAESYLKTQGENSDFSGEFYAKYADLISVNRAVQRESGILCATQIFEGSNETIGSKLAVLEGLIQNSYNEDLKTRGYISFCASTDPIRCTSTM